MLTVGEQMKIKVFDEEHEDDLTEAVNTFLCEHDIQLMDIHFSTAVCMHEEEQIYCFSALLLYEE